MEVHTKNNTPTFADRVCRIVMGIPPGSTLSYQEVAKRAGNPRAARAVAQIMARNYDSAIPCHRVIRSNGTLGGYNRGGPAQKAILLHSELLLLEHKYATEQSATQKK